MRELVARVKNLLKRNANLEDTSVLEYDDLKLDLKIRKNDIWR
jgi:DNA-binding response OmpR family regulator